MHVIVPLVLLWLLATAIVLGKVSRIFTPAELRRRARTSQGSRLNKTYSMFSYNAELKLIIWLAGSLSLATILIRLSGSGWISTVVFILLLSWIVFAWHPKKASGWYWAYCALLAPALTKVLSLVQPLVSRIQKIPGKLWPINVHTGIFEEEDLLKLIKDQKDQPENRIPETDLRVAYGALALTSKKISEVMIPRRQMKMVAEKDDIGPHLLDELHASGFSRFPVVSALTKSASIEVTGTLYLRDLVGHSSGGLVKDYMVRDVCFINENGSLRQALDGFIKTRHHMLVVVNGFEEIVGIITIEDIMEQIFGTKILDEFDQYEDIRAVASAEAKKDRNKHKEVETPKQTVVE